MLQRLEALLEDQYPLTNYLFYHLKGLLALLDGHRAEAFTLLQKASEREVRLPMAHVGGSARLLQAQLFLEQGEQDRAFAAAYPILNEWSKGSTPGYVLLDGPVILPVLRLVAQRGVPAAAQMLNLFSRPLPETKNSGKTPEPLTPREYDVLKLLMAGRSNIQIGDELHISRETVKSHVEHIFRKLDVHSRTQAVLCARELGF